MVNLNKTQIKILRKLSHNLKPVVMLGGKGLSDTVLAEIELALDAHELIKIQINGTDKSERQKIVMKITKNNNATHIYTIGKQAVFYRQSDDIKIDFLSLSTIN